MMAMLWLEANNITVEYGENTVLDIDRLEIHENERIGLVGENGAGKSTLLRILAGEQTPDAGTVRRLKPIARIAQMDDKRDAFFCDDPALRAEFRAEPDRPGLSGGERTRRRIASALASGAHILLADEPTTDLDAQGIARLTKHLRAWDGALVLVSHDRALLDALVDTVWALEDGRVTVYPGNYTAYRAELERRRAYQQFEYDQYRAERARLGQAAQATGERAARVRKTPARMGNSEARLHKRESGHAQARISQAKNALQSRAARLEEKPRPREDIAIAMRLGANAPIPGRFAIAATGITCAIGDRILLAGADIALPTGSRTALIGPNGCGKTTLIRYLADGGAGVYTHPRAKLGIFGQDHAQALDLTRSALDNVLEHAVTDESTARTVLARLGLRGDSVFRPVSVMSGGERAKLAIARLLVSDANVLLLDEPTNHLDVFMLEALGELLAGYAGTLLFVSHDRAFVERVATRVATFRDRTIDTREAR